MPDTLERERVSIPGEGWTRWRSPIGYPLAAFCLWLAHPTLLSVLGGSVIALAGLLVRAAAAGHLRKWQALAVSGPYAHTRNPLYFGSVLMAVGFALASGSWLVVLIVVGYFALFYPMVMRREAAELRERYGEPYEAYAQAVPLFWPSPARRLVAGTQERFSFAQYVRNREYQAAIGYVALVAVFAALAMWRK